MSQQRQDFLTFSPPTTPGSRTSSVPREFTLLVTDTLESPGTFLLTHFIARALRPPPLEKERQRQTVLVGLSNSFEHYEAILKKTGVQLSTEREAGRFVFVAPPASLQELFALLSSVLESGSLLLLDDLSSLLWAGHSATTTAGFFKRVQTLVYGDQVKGSLIVLLHGDELVAAGTADDDVLFRKVLQTSDLWLETKSLSSQTRGELSIHRAPALVDDFGVGERSGRTAWEYKLEEAGAVFSVKGLGKGFL